MVAPPFSRQRWQGATPIRGSTQVLRGEPEQLLCPCIPAIRGEMMKTMTALEAKNAFGRFLDAAQREPVTLTKNRRRVAALFSMEDVSAMAQAYLSEPLREQVVAGEIGVTNALIRQARMNESVSQSRREVAEGKTRVMDDGYFDSLRAQVRKLAQ